MLNRRARAILNRFIVAESALLGVGSESSVFAIDATQVLRIYRPHITWEYVGARLALVEKIRAQAGATLPALPEVLSVNAWADQVYTVERRMPGRDFARVIPTLTGADRVRALTSFVDAAAQIGRVRFDDAPFGELLENANTIHRAVWVDYLWAKLTATLATSRPALVQDVPELDAVLAHLRRELEKLAPMTEKRLVHGDYFAGNVFIDDDLQICGLGDFGYSTLVGDPRMDLAAAVAFWDLPTDLMPPAQVADDCALLMDLLVARGGQEIEPVVQLYRLYYSLYFSGCGEDDPTTYAWCVRNLRAAAHLL
jgi:Ser/Thr protein kinase RdoA (MazF antagonist)